MYDEVLGKPSDKKSFEERLEEKLLEQGFVTVRKWKYPAQGQLPEQRDKFYVVDTYGNHRIMTYAPDGAWGGCNWVPESGISTGHLGNEEIKCWTELLTML